MRVQPARVILKELERIQRAGYDSRTIFEYWIELSLAGLTMLPIHLQSVSETGQLADDTPQIKELFSEARKRFSRDQKIVFHQFSKAFSILLDFAYDGDEPTYEDIVGQVYEEWGIGNARAGQYFTPAPVAEMISVMVGGESIAAEVEERLRSALRETPTYRMMSLMGHEPGLETLRGMLTLQETPIDYKPVRVYDPACGSGIMLLGVAKCLPRWMVELGLVEFWGQDLDRVCVAMAQVNVRLYGLNRTGVMIRKISSESDEYDTTETGQLKLL